MLKMIKSALRKEKHKKKPSEQFNYEGHIYWKADFEVSYHLPATCKMKFQGSTKKKTSLIEVKCIYFLLTDGLVML